MKTLVADLYVGELGWELINWVPKIYALSRHHDYTVVHGRPGREDLYPFVDRFVEVEFPTEWAEGDAILPAKRMLYQGDLSRADRVVKETCDEYTSEGPVTFQHRPPVNGYLPGREFFKYEPDDAERWAGKVQQPLVVLCYRDRNLGPTKNWPTDRWAKLIERLFCQCHLAIVGKTEQAVTPFAGVLDFRNQTNMGDLISLFSLAKLVVGQSSGTMHLASLSGAQHVVWGEERLRQRYKVDWNPLKTQVEFVEGWNPDPDTVASVVESILLR